VRSGSQRDQSIAAGAQYLTEPNAVQVAQFLVD
jgi:hypothetical protein